MRTSCALGGATSISSMDRSLPASQATAACSRSVSPYFSSIRTCRALLSAACGACISHCGSARPAPQWTQRPWPARPNDGNGSTKEACCSLASSVTYLASNGLTVLAMLLYDNRRSSLQAEVGSSPFLRCRQTWCAKLCVKRENGYMSEERDGETVGSSAREEDTRRSYIKGELLGRVLLFYRPSGGV
jgi:hypothetical protein